MAVLRVDASLPSRIMTTIDEKYVREALDNYSTVRSLNSHFLHRMDLMIEKSVRNGFSLREIIYDDVAGVWKKRSVLANASTLLEIKEKACPIVLAKLIKRDSKIQAGFAPVARRHFDSVLNALKEIVETDDVTDLRHRKGCASSAPCAYCRARAIIENLDNEGEFA